METIIEIFDGAYGCEEGSGGSVLEVLLRKENGEQHWVRMDEEWLNLQHLQTGSTINPDAYAEWCRTKTENSMDSY